MSPHRLGFVSLVVSAALALATNCGRSPAAAPVAPDGSEVPDASDVPDAGCRETDSEFCQRLGAACGALAGVDACGHERTVESCGTCGAMTVCENHVCESCIDTEVRTRYGQCRATRTESDCRAVGGLWLLNEFHPYGDCICPTGEGRCPCNKSSDCTLGWCLSDCYSATEWKCPASDPLGCWFVVEGGSICWD